MTVNVYTVVVDKFVVAGFCAVGFTRLPAGDHEYVYDADPPVALPDRDVLVPFGMEASLPAFAVGVAFTVIVTASEAVHPPLLVAVTVYVVVVAGLAVGFETVVELRPAAGLHA